MDHKELFARALGISSPWKITTVALLEDAGEIRIQIAYRHDRRYRCPHCGKSVVGYDRRTRTWRHLDFFEYRTLVTAEIPRINCPEHGIIQLPVPWAEPGSSLTSAFETLLSGWLQEAPRAAVARRWHLSWDIVDGIYRRAVTRALKRRTSIAAEHLCVDETSWTRSHKYVTVILDADSGGVLHVAADRSAESLAEYYAQLTLEERTAIKTISMDMWDPYIKSTRAWVPDADAKICFDKFHVATHLGFAVDQTRREEHRALRAEGDPSLKATRFIWLKNPWNMDVDQRRTLNHLRRSSLRTAEAWGFKELVMDLWHYVSPHWARKAWDAVIADAEASSLLPIRRVGGTLRRYLWGIINAVVLKRTNAMAESVNSRIQKAKARACGYRSLEGFRLAIYFHCGKLDLSPT